MNTNENPSKPVKESQPKQPSGGSPPPPVEPQSREGSGKFLPLVVVLLLVVVGLFIVVATARRGTKPATDTSEPASAQPVEAASVSNAPPAAVSNSVPTPPPLKLKLQGILFNQTRPGAIVNGRPVYVGSHVDKLLVKDISKDTVILEAADGTQQKLVLGK